MAFEVVSSLYEGGQAVLRLAGEFDLATVPEFDKAVAEALEADVRVIIVELSGVSFIDATGVTALLSGWRRATNSGASMSFRHPNRSVWRVLEVLELTGELPIESDN